MDRPIVVVDTETATILGAPHLLEIGAVRVVDGEAVDRFQMLVRPQVPVEERAFAIHGIADQDVRDAPDAGEAVTRFCAWLGDDWLVAHGARFDAGVLGFECVRWGLPMPHGPFLDTVKLARQLITDAPDHKLSTLCQWLEIEATIYHRALPDAVSCWKVFEACVERLPAEPTPCAEGVWSLCGRPVTVPAAAPRPPRIAPRLRPLEEACRKGARVTVIYGDEERTSALCIAPRILFESRRRGYMEAECTRSGLLKTYRLDRVRSIQNGR